ncbi:MAG: ATP-binding protein [Gammaproteobacteria bacterium]|nr:ATP-binding protein [Gammaproteobacteria bacterium]
MLRRLNTQQQLFLAIAGTGVFLVVVVLLGVRSYFLQNFSDYLAEQEQRRLQQVAVVLSEYYETFHRQMPARVRAEFSEREIWRQVIQTIQRDLLINPERVNLDPDLSFSALTLETIGGERIFGPDIAAPVTVFVLSEGQIIATLSTELPTSQMQPLDQVFRQQQMQSFLWAGALALVVAALAAWFVATRLRARLALLKRTTQQIAAGDYASKLSPRLFDNHQRDDIAELALALQTMATTLNNTEQQRRAFMADIAHELRTPLTVLKGELEAVEDGIRQPDKVLCSRLQQQTEQLARLVSDIDTLAQAQAGGMNYQRSSIDLKQWLQQQVTQWQALAEQHHLQLTLTVSEDSAVTVQADTSRLQQALQNLLQNSVRYTESSEALPGQVRVSLTATPTHAVISIEDTAPGVATEHLAHLFERFYRTDSHRHRQQGGSGLGLAISRQIVQAHHGSIHAEPSELGGLKVTITLPRDSA